MIDVSQIRRHTLQREPYDWAEIGNLFSPRDAAALAASFPCDHYKTVASYGGERDWEYEARSLIPMGEHTISHADDLSEAWLMLAQDLLSPAYRIALSLLTECDLTTVPLEVNVFHYGPGANLGPHPDLDDKLVTHVMYFNRTWNRKDGGCLSILRSADHSDVAFEIPPIVGNSAVLVRSDKSWHAVSRVRNGCERSRRSLTATFYRPGSVSTMWPPGDMTPVRQYQTIDPELKTGRSSFWERLQRRMSSNE